MPVSARLTVSLAAALLTQGVAAMAGQSAQDSVAGATAIGPRDAGARYGQALGAAEICIGWRPSAKASSLGAAFTGAELDAFKSQTAKVLDAWVKVKNCARPEDPNECKIIMDKSCEAAIAEIGPDGTALPGLLDPPQPK